MIFGFYLPKDCFSKWRDDIPSIQSCLEAYLKVKHWRGSKRLSIEMYENANLVEKTFVGFNWMSTRSFFKWAILGLFFAYFRSFQTKIQILEKNNVKKCPSGIRYRDSNSQPPFSTRPGLPPALEGFLKVDIVAKILFFSWSFFLRHLI